MKGKDNFRELLGIQVLEVKDGYAKMCMKVTKEHVNFVGFTHGGGNFCVGRLRVCGSSKLGR